MKTHVCWITEERWKFPASRSSSSVHTCQDGVLVQGSEWAVTIPPLSLACSADPFSHARRLVQAPRPCSGLQFEPINCLLKTTRVMLSLWGFFNHFLKVIRLRYPSRKSEFPHLKILGTYLEAWAWSVSHRAWRWWPSSGSRHCEGLASGSQFWSWGRCSGRTLPRPGTGICTPLKAG